MKIVENNLVGNAIDSFVPLNMHHGFRIGKIEAWIPCTKMVWGNWKHEGTGNIVIGFGKLVICFWRV